MKINTLIIVWILFFFSVANFADAQWKQLKGTNKKSITCFALNDSTIIAGTYDDGILLSHDKGVSWKTIEKNLPNDKCRNINALLCYNNVVYAGTCHGVYASDDNGYTWYPYGNEEFNYYTLIDALAITENKIFAGSYGDGLFSSNNNDQNWIKSNLGITDKFVTSLVVVERNIFVGTNTGGVFLSEDNGESWTAVNDGLPEETSVKSLAVNGSTIFAGTDGGGVNVFAVAPEGNGIYVSHDNGSNWIPANIGIENKTVESIAVIKNNVFAILKFGKLFLSQNNGKSWKEIGLELPKDINVNVITVIGTTIYAGTNNGIWKEENILNK